MKHLTKYPLLHPVSDIQISENGLQMIISTRLSVEKHVYLGHHVFAGKPIMPGASMIETAIEAVSLYCEEEGLDESNVVEIADFDILRAITLGFQESLVIRTHVSLDGTSATPKRFQVKITSDARNSAGEVVRKDRVHCRAVVLAAIEPLKPRLLKLEPRPDMRRITGSKADYYKETKTHGTLLQSFTGKYAMSASGASMLGEFDTANLETQFVPSVSAPMLASPLAMDSAFQLFVRSIDVSLGMLRLPVGGRGLRFYRPPNPTGLHRVMTNKTLEDDNVSVGRIEMTTDRDELCFEFDEFRFRPASLVAKIE